MKRIITYISILAAALTAGVSCSRDLSFDENQDGGKLTLVFRTEQMGTRVTVNDADPVKGVGAENAIEHVDYFFFADDDPTSEAVVSGRLTVDQLTKVSDTEYKYDGFDTSLNAYKALQGPTYLYVLANYPETVNATTMEDILALPISTDFKEEQTSFVMDTYDSAEESVLLYLTPKASDGTTPREVEVPLARAAAKIVLNFDVKNSYEDAAGNVWTPVTDQMWVNFLYARKNTTVAAEAVEFDEKANYYNTDQETPASVTAVDADHTSWKASPVYTYPQGYETSDVTAPYFKIFCPWTCEKKGLNNFYYKIILPDLGSFQRNKIYTVNVEVSVIGGTEDDWALVSDYIYVADWWAPEAIVASFEGGMYLDVPVKEYSIYGVDDVYIPVRSSNDIRITNISGTKTNLYNDNAVSVTGTTADVTKDGFKFVHALNSNVTSSNFDSTPISFTMTVQHTQGGLSKTVNVKVIQYPSIYATRIRSNGYVFVNGQTYEGNGDYGSVYNNNHNGIGSVVRRATVNGTGSNNNQNNYNIYVSVLPDGSEDIIGDPRFGAAAVNNLGFATFGYWQNNTARNSTVDNTVSSKYKAAGQNTEHVIAPAFKIASSYGKTTAMSRERARERCASYQEDGYPAGRWRLPTSAEVLFVRNLSRYQHIPALFQTHINDGYWTANSYIYSTTEYGDITTNTATNRSVRCVYDVWYWGEAPLTNSGADATPIVDENGIAHDYNNEATQWLGFRMD